MAFVSILLSVTVSCRVATAAAWKIENEVLIR